MGTGGAVAWGSASGVGDGWRVANMFEVSDDDEVFVLSLIKKLRKYRATNGAAEEEDPVDDQ